MPNKNRTLVKLDDCVLEIKEVDGKYHATKLSDDDLVEVSLLDEGVERMLENDVNKIANEAYDELRNSFKHTLKSNVLNIVGFTNRWDKWEVDHCNGRASALTAYMSDRVQHMFRTEFDNLLQPEIAKMVAPLKQQLVAEYKDMFTRAVRDHLRTEAQDAAKQFLTEIMSSQMQKLQKVAIEQAKTAFLGRKTNGDQT